MLRRMSLLVVFFCFVLPARTNAAATIRLPSACNLNGIEPLAPLRWIAVWNFDSPTGCILYTGESQNPQLPPPIVDYKLVYCESKGKVQFGAGYAIFEGKVYLSCPFSLQREGQPDEADYAHFWIYAQISTLFQSGQLPIVNHPDFALQVNAPTPTLNWAEWSLRRADDSVSTGQSIRFAPTIDDRLRLDTCLMTSLTCPGKLAGAYAQRMRINQQSNYDTPVNAPMRMRLTETTLYIGFDPKQETYFQGRMGMLVLDPAYGKDPTPDALPPLPQ